MKSIVYMHVNEPVVLINPVIKLRNRRKVLVWDDCMSCPDLLVKVKRYRRCKVEYRDENWNKRSMYLEGKLATLMQHEVDHLQGILITQKRDIGQELRAQERAGVSEIAGSPPERRIGCHGGWSTIGFVHPIRNRRHVRSL